MWDRTGFLSFFAGLCLANRVAMASLGERDALPDSLSETQLRNIDRLQRRDLPLAPFFVPRQQAAHGSGAVPTGTDTSAATDLPNIIAVGLSPSEVSQLASLATTLDPTGTETVIFVPASGTRSASLFIPSADAAANTGTGSLPPVSGPGQASVNPATAVPISFPSNGVPQVPSQLTGAPPAATQSQQGFPSGPSNPAGSQMASGTNFPASVGPPASFSAPSPAASPFSFSYPIVPTMGEGATFTAPFGSSVFSFTVPAPTGARDSGISTAPFSSGEPNPTTGLQESGVFTAPFSSGEFSFSFPAPTRGKSFTSETPSMTHSASMPMPTSHTQDSITSSPSSSSESSTFTSSTTSLSSITSTSTTSQKSSSTISSPTNTSTFNSAGATMSPGRTHPLSNGAIAGIVVGVAAALALLGALLLWLIRRRTRKPVPTSPRVYPEEAYLYDPPMNDGNAPAMAGPSGPQAGPSGYGAVAGPSNGASRGAPLPADGYNPYVPAGAAAGAAAGAGALAAVGASRAANRGYAPIPAGEADHDGEGYTSPPKRAMSPQRFPGTAAGESSNLLGAAGPSSAATTGHRQQHSIDSDAGDLGNAEPYRDFPPENPFVDPSDPEDIARQNRWPLNPRGENGLTPPGSSSGNAGYSSLNAGPGPSNYQGVSPQMREVRRAWGWEQ